MNFRALIAEFVGTLALIYCGLLAIHHLGGLPNNGGLLGISLAFGLVVACVGTAFGAVSGGHFNPAISIALAVAGKFGWGAAGAYAVAQMLGGFVGAYAAQVVLGSGGLDTVIAGTPAVGQTATVGTVFAAEAIAAFLLVTVVFGTGVDPRSPRLGALLIGLTLALGILTIGPITGGSINPARWFGPAMVASTWTNAWVYIAAPIVGGVVAALGYRFLFSEEADKAATKTAE